MKRHAAAFLLWFVGLWWLWMLLAGEWNHTEWIAATCAAAIGGALGEIARTLAGANTAPPVATLAAVPTALAMVFVDFVIVIAALFTRREGAFLESDADPPSLAWGEYLATISPNAYVLDPQTTHHLVPFKKSQEPM